MGDSSVVVRTGRICRELGRGQSAPTVAESETLHLQGLRSWEEVRLGPLPFVADGNGRLSVRLLEDEGLRGHLGLVELRRQSGHVAGEFAVLPDKMSESAFETLRSELERLWAGLIFDTGGVSHLQAKLPSPAELWRAIEDPVREIAAEPRTILIRGEGVRRLEAVRGGSVEFWGSQLE